MLTYTTHVYILYYDSFARSTKSWNGVFKTSPAFHRTAKQISSVNTCFAYGTEKSVELNTQHAFCSWHNNISMLCSGPASWLVTSAGCRVMFVFASQIGE
jgi:hypothetical protein